MAESGALKDWLPLLTAAMTLFTAVFVWWSTKTTKKAVDEAKAAVLEVHLSLNSRLDEYLKVTREAEHAKGKLEGEKSAAASNTSIAEPHDGLPGR